MSGLDFALLVILASYAWVGFTAGFVQGVGSLIGVLLGAFAASHSFHLISPMIAPWVGGEISAAVLVFVALFLIVSRLVGLAFTLLNRAFSLFRFLPFVKITNALGGAILGLVEGIFATGLTLHFLARLPVGSGVTEALNVSRLVPFLTGASGWLVSLLPEVLRQATSVL